MSISMAYFDINPNKAPIFCTFSDEERKRIISIYEIKREKSEFPDEYVDEISRIEYTAIQLHSQLCAFHDVLTKEGFEPTCEAQKDYDGAIAYLSYYGTLVIFGKPKPNRYVLMTRLHTLSQNKSGKFASFTSDLKLNCRSAMKLYLARLQVVNGDIYRNSPLCALAINPNGFSGDKLEEKEKIQYMTDSIIKIGSETMRELLKPISEPAEK